MPDFTNELIKLLPVRFQEVTRLQDFLAEAGDILDELDVAINEVPLFFSPDEVKEEFISYIAVLMGVELYRGILRSVVTGESGEDELARLRMILRSIPDTIKAKGTKPGMTNLTELFFPMMQELDWTIYELYTKNYTEFKTYGTEVDSDLYKSPHVLVEFPSDVLDQFGGGSEAKELYNKIVQFLKRIKPAHVVIHDDKDQSEDIWIVSGTPEATSLGFDIYDSAYGDGVWVAVGTGGNIATSTDGETWDTVVSPDASWTFYGVAYGNGRWIIVGDGNVGGSPEVRGFYSDDLVTWTMVDIQMVINAYGIAYHDGRWVIVGPSQVSYSIDSGETWTGVTISAGKLSNVYRVAYGNGKWIAVGGNSTANISSDGGETWVEVNTGSSGALWDVAYYDGRWIAVGVSCAAYSDDDGVSWTPLSGSDIGFTPETARAIEFGGEFWLIVGTNGTASYSYDGLLWIPIDAELGSDDGYALAFNESYSWVILGTAHSYWYVGRNNRVGDSPVFVDGDIRVGGQTWHN